MKTLIIMTTLLISALIFFILANSHHLLTTTEVSVLHDLTDKHLSQPDANELYALFHLSGNDKWNGAMFRFSNVTDVSFNRTDEISLNAANQLFSNEFTREKQIENFKDSLAKIVADAGSDATGKENSSIYLPIANELIYLSRSTAKKRSLIIYSDLMENNLDFSFYHPDQLQLLELHPETISEKFEKQKALPSLKGIEVYFVYQPADPDADREFRIVSEFYKKLLEKKGANVFISANLTL